MVETQTDVAQVCDNLLEALLLGNILLPKG